MGCLKLRQLARDGPPGGARVRAGAGAVPPPPSSYPIEPIGLSLLIVPRSHSPRPTILSSSSLSPVQSVS